MLQRIHWIQNKDRWGQRLSINSDYTGAHPKIDLEDELIITKEAYQDLQLWQRYVSQWNHHPVIVQPVQVQITRNASHLGWGAILDKQEAAGQCNFRQHPCGQTV